MILRCRTFGVVCLALLLALTASSAASQAQVRTFYIAADDVLWNFAPSGRDLVSGTPLPQRQALQLGWTYHKAIYRQYSDATFRHLEARAPKDAYLGLLGPIIRAEVGDTNRRRVQEQHAAASACACPRHEVR